MSTKTTSKKTQNSKRSVTNKKPTNKKTVNTKNIEAKKTTKVEKKSTEEVKNTILKDKKSIMLGACAGVALAILAILSIFQFKGYLGTSKIMRDFNKYYNSKERMIIYYAKPSCAYCKLQTPILETVASDYNIKYYYLDVSKLTSKENKEVMEKLKIEKSATPITVIVEKGEVIDSNVGYAEAESYLEFLKRNDLVSDDAVYSAEKSITKISFNDYENMFSDGESHIVVIGRTGCSHCTEFKPAMNYVAEKNKITINYLDLATLSEDESSSLMANLGSRGFTDPDFLSDGSFGTPTTLIIKNNTIVRYFIGSKTISGLTKELEKAGIIVE